MIGAVEGGKGGRRLVEHRDAFLGEETQKSGGVPRRALRHDHETPAVKQRPPDLPDREVERDGVEQGPDIAGPEAEPAIRRTEEPCDRRMFDGDALRLAGRTGGVDHIGEIVGRSRAPRRRRVRLGVFCLMRIDPLPAWRQPVGVLGGDYQQGIGILDHEGEALARIGRVERQIAGAALQDRDQRDD